MGLNLGDMALAAGVSEPTVRRWVREGCPTVSKGGNGVAYEFDPARVKAWRDERDRLEGEADAERERQIAEAQAELFAGEKLAPVGFDPKRHREELNLEHEAIRLGLLKKTLIPAEDVRRTAAAMPNNRILWRDLSFVKTGHPLDYKVMTPTTWHCEETATNPQDTAHTKDV